MGKLAALKKQLGLAQENKGKVAENVSKHTDKVSEEQVEDKIDAASEKVKNK